jgi:pilus assembly protein Flp/PilA
MEATMTEVSISEARRLAARFLADERGATAIEYALIAAGIGATIATTVWAFGSQLRDGTYSKVYNVM